MKDDEILVRGLTGKPNVFLEGKLVTVPVGWIFVPSGDPLLTRRIKSAGEYWVHVRERKGRTESVGVWAPAEHVEAARQKIAAEREDPAYQKRRGLRRQVLPAARQQRHPRPVCHDHFPLHEHRGSHRSRCAGADPRHAGGSSPKGE